MDSKSFLHNYVCLIMNCLLPENLSCAVLFSSSVQRPSDYIHFF